MEHKDQTFYEKLKKRFGFKLKLSEQEKTIAEIIQRVLMTPGTRKITPVGEDPYYAINSDIDHFIRIGCGTVTILSSEGSLVRDVPAFVSDYYRELIQDAVHQDAVEIETNIFQKDMRLLQRMESRLPSYAEDTHSA